MRKDGVTFAMTISLGQISQQSCRDTFFIATMREIATPPSSTDTPVPQLATTPAKSPAGSSGGAAYKPRMHSERPRGRI